ncbi:uncharacterized protein F4807DRAFT_432943 [Annulohypoxylon truncatum]|uniref:uncharacterized protein n=1 Tax=Annulohypoxylon truncatum TaxID=327061 RepID=UPI0020072517|nr:uncharacterized protein F4807DRAFT_432943 [Annulohypoxylon truncatum]KAI1208036.1 hypothetical protein F4807DRAFT_432943 [Annulohypoxylon truncatum]
MAKGLALARSFYLSGHRVIGADFEDRGSPCPGRYSRSLSVFYSLPKTDSDESTETYVHRLIEITKTENADIWVSCSGVANAIQDARAKESIEQHTSCMCIQFGVETTSVLHNKGSFMEECKDRGLPVPETHEVKSKHDILRVLSVSKISTPERRFILKPIGLDDINRGNMTLLPLPLEEDTKLYISRLPISASNPWILQQFIPGREEYCTHSLVVRGEVKCFVACPSAELLMHYKPLPSNSPLWQAMYAFTVEFVQRSPNPEDMTGHLSFDFMASEGTASYCGTEKNIYAIECNPRAHTAVVLFAQRGPEMEAMVDAYITTVERRQEGLKKSFAEGKGSQTGTQRLIVPPANTKPRYWIGHDLVSLFIHPMMLWCFGHISFSRVLSDTLEFSHHLRMWKEGTFEVWDPFPALFLYHVYWPIVILSAWWNEKHWSRVNVSTTKMFTC